MLQPQKQKRGHAFSYKPSILANDKRVVTAMDVDPSNEVSVVEGLFKQSMEVTGNFPEESLFDAGYFSNKMVSLTLEHDISLLCSEKPKYRGSKEGQLFLKGDFRYIELEDVYICPAGEALTTNKNRGVGTSYTTTACEACELRVKCTNAERGRRNKREPGDIEKELLRGVMRHPQAKKILYQRKAMVEPVFSVLRLKQGLNRFRRKGLEGVKREFALHMLAYNLSRYIAAAIAIYPLSHLLKDLGAIACLEAILGGFFGSPVQKLA